MLTPAAAAVKFDLPFHSRADRLAPKASMKGSVRFGIWSNAWRTLPISISPFIKLRKSSSGIS